MDTHATLVHEARSTLSFNARQRLGSGFQGALKRRIQTLPPLLSAYAPDTICQWMQLAFLYFLSDYAGVDNFPFARKTSRTRRNSSYEYASPRC